MIRHNQNKIFDPLGSLDHNFGKAFEIRPRVTISLECSNAYDKRQYWPDRRKFWETSTGEKLLGLDFSPA